MKVSYQLDSSTVSSLLFPLDESEWTLPSVKTFRRLANSLAPPVQSCFHSHPDHYFIHYTVWAILAHLNIPNLKKFRIPGKCCTTIRALCIRRICSLEAWCALCFKQMNPAIPTQASIHFRLRLNIFFLFVTASNSYYWNTLRRNSKNQYLSVLWYEWTLVSIFINLNM